MKQQLFAVISAITILVASINAIGPVNAAKVSSPAVKDIAGHWAESSITSMINKGYVNGYPDGTFKPNATITRAEFMKMIVNLRIWDYLPSLCFNISVFFLHK